MTSSAVIFPQLCVIKMNTLTYRENSCFRQVYHEIYNENLYLKKFLQESIRSFERVEIELQKEFSQNEHLMDKKTSDNAEMTKLLDLLAQENYSRRLYPTFILSNILLSVYSVFETNLIRLINIIDSLAKSGDYFNPRAGDLHKKALQHIKDKAAFNMASVGKDWNYVDDLSLLRNFIVHYNGNLRLYEANSTPEKIKCLRNLVNRDSSLRFSDDKKVIITSEDLIHRYTLSCERLIHKTVIACEDKFEIYSYDIVINPEERKIQSRTRIK